MITHTNGTTTYKLDAVDLRALELVALCDEHDEEPYEVIDVYGTDDENVTHGPAYLPTKRTSRRLAPMDRPTINQPAHTKITITYHATPNGLRPHRFVPVIDVNGKFSGSTYCERDYERQEALDLAEIEAHKEASHFVGDWDITILAAN